MLCRKTVAWLYRLDRSLAWESALPVHEDLVFLDGDGKVRLIVESGGRLTVTRGYAWNGCSPKVCILDLLIGTPDGAVYQPTGRPKAYYASLVHDALYQFLDAGSPITRAQADDCFLRLMGESEFVLRHVYWAAVRVFGGFVWQGKKAARNWRGEALPVSALGSGAALRDARPGEHTREDEV
jgi:hypothetical protein